MLMNLAYGIMFSQALCRKRIYSLTNNWVGFLTVLIPFKCCYFAPIPVILLPLAAVM